MKCFDIHVHIFPDKIAARTVEMLGSHAKIAPTYDGSRAGLVASMERAGLAGALNCPIATKKEQVVSINEWAAAQNRWPVLSLGTIHPDTPEPAAVLASLKARGLPGIKLHPEYQQFTPDDPRLWPIGRACRDLGLVLLLHAGEDIGFDPPYHSSPEGVRHLVEEHPGLKLVAAHFGGWRLWDEVDRRLVGQPVYLDVSFIFGMLPDARIVEMARRHGVERVVYGSDAPWRSQADDLRYFLSLPFTVEEQERILWRNAAGLLGFDAG
ncbi:MAG: Amidohydrolase [Lentisphaerae bacterium ADurb.BinA184]|nr:MAG: Amidohydrolase [Lentisphaerae bacterium ADurb.BinA184]